MAGAMATWSSIIIAAIVVAYQTEFKNRPLLLFLFVLDI
jgi:hypothetical protein